MSQRLTLAAFVFVLVASFASTAATWFVIENGRRANEAMLAASREANESLIAQGRETNAALLKKLDELSTTGREEPVSLEWNSVKVRLYTGEKPGTPATDFKVTLNGHVLDTSKSITLTRTTDATGTADFGLVRPGEHSIVVTAPWKETTGELPLYVLPGKSIAEEIQCPAAVLPKSDVRFEVEWPDDLQSRGYWLICHFVEEGRAFGEGSVKRTWSRPAASRENFLLLDAETQVVPFPFGNSYRNPSQTPLPWPFYPSNGSPFDIRGLVSTFGRRAGFSLPFPKVDEFQFVFQRLASAPQIRLAAASYQLEAILIGESPRPCSSQDAWNLMYGRHANEKLEAPIDDFAVESRTDLMTTSILGGVLARGTEMRGIPDGFGEAVYRPLADWHHALKPNKTAMNAELRRRHCPRFVAEEGKLNVWKLKLPDPLLERVRGNPNVMKAETDAKERDVPEDDAATTSGDKV